MMILHQREEDIANIKKEQELLSQRLSEKSTQMNSYHTDYSQKEINPRASQKSISEKNFISYDNVNDYNEQQRGYQGRNTHKSTSQTRSPLQENLAILNHQDEYAHTEDSFGEYNNHYREQSMV